MVIKCYRVFIFVSNIKSKETQAVISGNERVMHARLSDAAFFFNSDKKVSLGDRLEQLKTITFQKGLGSLFDKAKRLEKLSGDLAKKLSTDQADASQAGLLAKADLASDMVGEFPALQGIMGRYYAKNDGLAESITLAIGEQYHPSSASDRLPVDLTACCVGSR